MPFLLLLVLIPPCLQDSWPEPGFWTAAPLRIAGLTWGAMAGAVAVAAVWAVLVRQQLAFYPDRRGAVLHNYGRWRHYHFFGLVSLYGLSLYVFGWGWAVQRLLGTATLPPGAELVILAPFLAGLVLSWLCYYEIERTLHDAEWHGSHWTRWEFLGLQIRHNVLVLVPVALLIGMRALRWLAAGAGPGWAEAASGIDLVAAAACFLGMPWLLRLAWNLRPLPAGPLRDRLETAARRLKFRYSDILVWNTHSGVANALVIGFFPLLRYVVLTDRLVADLSPDEVEAVFGHEAGHIKHRHMLYYLGFLVASMLAVWSVLAVFVLPHFDAVPSLTNRDDLGVLTVVFLLGVYLFVVFGFVSRNCERQADLYGCRAVSCSRWNCTGHGAETGLVAGANGLCPTGIQTFMDALEKVGRLNGISRDRPGWLQSWQHSTIARRVGFLERVSADRRLATRFQRILVVVKGLLLASLLALVVLLGWSFGWDKLMF